MSISENYIIPVNDNEKKRVNIIHESFLGITKQYLYAVGLDTLNKDQLVLDMGCSTGLTTEWIAFNTKASLLAMDTDLEHITVAKQKFTNIEQNFNNVQFQTIDLSEEHHNPVQSDLTYCRFVLHHLTQPKQGLNNLINMTIEGGQIVVGEPIMYGQWIYPEEPIFYEIWGLLF